MAILGTSRTANVSCVADRSNPSERHLNTVLKLRLSVQIRVELFAGLRINDIVRLICHNEHGQFITEILRFIHNCVIPDTAVPEPTRWHHARDNGLRLVPRKLHPLWSL